MTLPLSICIPTYNRDRLLRRTLDHLKGLQHLFSEIVISDNASSDDTPNVIAAAQREFPRIKAIRQTENRGNYINIYAAFSAATSDYLFVLCDDDALVPDGFQRAFETLAADPDCVAVFGGYERCDADLGTSYGAYIPSEERFTKDDKVRLAPHAVGLTFPIVRREVLQRNCFLDNTTSGFLWMMSRMLDRGAIRLVPYAVYRHADTAVRMEQTATEPWYHDFLRSDWECYLASIGSVDFAMASEFVAGQTVNIYLAGQEYARQKDRPLAERTFLTRYLAYAAKGNPEGCQTRIDEWERTRLIAAVIALLRDRLELAGPVARLVVERGTLNVPTMIGRLTQIWRTPPVTLVDPGEFVDWPPAEGDFVLAERWQSLQARVTRHAVDPSRHLAIGDLIASLRLPGSRRAPLLTGPEGTLHFCAD